MLDKLLGKKVKKEKRTSSKIKKVKINKEPKGEKLKKVSIVIGANVNKKPKPKGLAHKEYRFKNIKSVRAKGEKEQ